MTLAYLASPFTLYAEGPHIAYRHVCKLAARLLRAGVHTYSPIAHSYGLAVHGGLDLLDHELWLPFDELMMTRCDTLIVAHMEGWQESKGVAHEIGFFLKLGRPIFDLDPVTLTMAKRS